MAEKIREVDRALVILKDNPNEKGPRVPGSNIYKDRQTLVQEKHALTQELISLKKTIRKKRAESHYGLNNKEDVLVHALNELEKTKIQINNLQEIIRKQLNVS